VSASPVRQLLAALPLLALLCACQGPSFQLADLPSEPLALVYRTREEAAHRAESIARAKEGPTILLPGEAYSRLEDVGDYFGLGRSQADKQRDILGRMALLDAATGEIELLRFAARGSRPLGWSRDRRLLLYQTPAEGDRQHLFEYDRETEEVRPIARGPYYYLGASYGPDGRVALSRIDIRKGAAARSRIFVTRPGGGSPRPVTPGPRDMWPVWSPDGSVLIYSSFDEAGKSVIRAVDPLEGGEPRFITRGAQGAFFPDGDWVVYSTKRRGRWTIWRVRPDGSGKHPIGSSNRNERDPTVSPDGRFIVYVAEDAEHQRLMVRPLDGSGDRQLLKDGDGLMPAW
jgi:dipeptidyl aminopeptidase/acylaminoacyl peptidase